MPVIDAEGDAPEVETPRSEERRPARPSGERPSSERTSGDSGRSYDRRPSDNRYAPRGGNDRVVGMGDHVPDFILRSFRIDTPVVEETEEEQAES
jgi:hypothetical protein